MYFIIKYIDRIFNDTTTAMNNNQKVFDPHFAFFGTTFLRNLSKGDNFQLSVYNK